MRVRVRLRPARSTKPWRYFRRWRPAGKHLQIDGDDFLENRRRHGNAADAQALQESWGDAGGPEAALHLAGIGHTDALEGEDLLQIHLLILHPQHFTDGEDFTGSVLQAGNLHDELDGAGQLLEDDAGGGFGIGAQHPRFPGREAAAGGWVALASGGRMRWVGCWRSPFTAGFPGREGPPGGEVARSQTPHPRH